MSFKYCDEKSDEDKIICSDFNVLDVVQMENSIYFSSNSIHRQGDSLSSEGMDNVNDSAEQRSDEDSQRECSRQYSDQEEKGYPKNSVQYIENYYNNRKAGGRGAAMISVSLGDKTNVKIFACKESGEILGPQLEGTLGIILYGRTKINDPASSMAIRLPRLLRSDHLINFHIAEIAMLEAKQSEALNQFDAVKGASSSHLLSRTFKVYEVLPDLVDSTDDFGTICKANVHDDCFITFFLAPNEPYRIGVVSENGVWPASLGEALGSEGVWAFLQTRLYRARSIASAEDFCASLEGLMVLPVPLSISSSNRSQNTDRCGDDDDDCDVQEENRQNSGEDDLSNKIINIGRQDLDLIYKKRHAGGWWFNLNPTVHEWLQADLERLMVGMLNVDSSDLAGNEPSQTLSKWKLSAWFALIERLSSALGHIHQSNSIHGDVRPANIMAKYSDSKKLDAASFNWIDVGLGYGATISSSHSEGTYPAPSPIGGARTSAFYSHERREGHEFEDIDVVKFVAGQGADDSELYFFVRPQTDKPAVPAVLKNSPLGDLQEGDRIQLREYLFEVKEVLNDNRIVVGSIFQVLYDQLLVKRSRSRSRNGCGVDELRMIEEDLFESHISRYQIHYKWSPHSDVYGMGVLLLYVLFMRGVFLKNKYEKERSRNGEDSQSPTNCGKKTKISVEVRKFSEFINLLNNDSFMSQILISFNDSQYNPIMSEHRGSIDPRLGDWNNDEFNNNIYCTLSKKIMGWHPCLPDLFRGVNKHPEVFILTLSAALRCMWLEVNVPEPKKTADMADHKGGGREQGGNPRLGAFYTERSGIGTSSSNATKDAISCLSSLAGLVSRLESDMRRESQMNEEIIREGYPADEFEQLFGWESVNFDRNATSDNSAAQIRVLQVQADEANDKYTKVNAQYKSAIRDRDNAIRERDMAIHEKNSASSSAMADDLMNKKIIDNKNKEIENLNSINKINKSKLESHMNNVNILVSQLSNIKQGVFGNIKKEELDKVIREFKLRSDRNISN